MASYQEQLAGSLGSATETDTDPNSHRSHYKRKKLVKDKVQYTSVIPSVKMCSRNRFHTVYSLEYDRVPLTTLCVCVCACFHFYASNVTNSKEDRP